MAKERAGRRVATMARGQGDAVISRSQMTKIAQLYYIENIGQREIAERMKISITSVSRSLAKAREMDIVQISINTGSNDFSQEEIEMEHRFSLEECMLVPSFENREYAYEHIAWAMSDLLTRFLKPGSKLGVSWGETMKTIGESMWPVQIGNIDVIPVVGAMGQIETGVYANGIARNIAEKVGGTAYLINTPALVDNPETCRSLMADSTFKPIADLWENLDMAILSVTDLNQTCSMFRYGIVTADDLSKMIAAGATCACNFVFFDAAGNCVSAPQSERILCLPLENMKKIPHLVIVSAGPSKVAPILSLLRSGLCAVLITDINNARAILARS